MKTRNPMEAELSLKITGIGARLIDLSDVQNCRAGEMEQCLKQCRIPASLVWEGVFKVDHLRACPLAKKFMPEVLFREHLPEELAAFRRHCCREQESPQAVG